MEQFGGCEMKRFFTIRRCGKGHCTVPEGYYLRDQERERELWWPKENFCSLDGTPITAVLMTYNSKEFRGLFKKRKKFHDGGMAMDWYELYCENGHRNMTGGYLSYGRHKYCGFCGLPIIKIVRHETSAFLTCAENTDQVKSN